MTYLLTASLGISITVLTAVQARAEFRSRNEIGIGITNNAYLENTNPRSDTFLRIATSNSYQTGAHTLGLRLSYYDYFQENPNDVFGWRVSEQYAPDGSAWKLSGALLGQSYPSEGPGTTDTSFDNFGLDLGARHAQGLSASTELEIGGGYKLRVYPRLTDRTDHILFGNAYLDYTLSDQVSLGARAELGMLSSTQDAYSKFYLEVGGSIDYAISPAWNWTGDISYRGSRLINRTTTTEVVTVRKRGERVSATVIEKEAYTGLSLSTEVSHKISDSIRVGVSADVANQNSVSGLQDYSAVEVLARLLFTF